MYITYLINVNSYYNFYLKYFLIYRIFIAL
jgi:hypothetical protein